MKSTHNLNATYKLQIIKRDGTVNRDNIRVKARFKKTETRERQAERRNWKKRVGEKLCFKERTPIPCLPSNCFHPARLSSV